jgi:hypothetical protein
MIYPIVIPAKAGIQEIEPRGKRVMPPRTRLDWIPAFAGMTT